MVESDTEKMVARLSAVTRKIGAREPDQGRWGLFTFEHWCKMLERRPDLAGKCPIDMLRRVKAELKRRDVAERKKRNVKVNVDELIEDSDCLEEARPQRPDPHTDAKRMTGADWVTFLIQNPKEWKLCDFSKLSGGDWVRLIRVRRYFYVFCNWGLFTMDDWCDLLTVRPQFAVIFEKA